MANETNGFKPLLQKIIRDDSDDFLRTPDQYHVSMAD